MRLDGLRPDASPEQRASVRRRDILRAMVGGGAMMALSGSLVPQAEAHGTKTSRPI